MSSESLEKLKETVTDFIDSLPWNKDTLRVKLKRAIKKAKSTGALDISYSTIVDFPPKALKLQNLTDLNISGNKIGANIPHEIFAAYPNLQFFECAGNGFEKVDTDINNFRVNLRKLNIAFNQLGPVLDSVVFNLNNLRILDLQHNKIGKLPNGIAALTHLTTLKLNDNQLVELPSEIGQLTRLSALHLQNNKLTTLPDEFANLEAIHELNILNNDFKTIPLALGGLKALEVLDLHGGILKHVPPQVGTAFQHFRIINLASNSIDSLPEEFALLEKAEKINVRHNLIYGWPLAVRSMSNLEFDWKDIKLDLIRIPEKEV